MANEILSYVEMCQREGRNLQRGMNFGIGGWYSVILMSVRPNAPIATDLRKKVPYSFMRVTTSPSVRLAMIPNKMTSPSTTSGGH